MTEKKTYYCPKCDRDHIEGRGKIYNNHLQYDKSRIQANIKEVEESPVEKYDIEEKIHEADIAVAGAMELDENVCDETPPTVSTEAIRDLPGVGDVAFKKLIKAGFNSLESIAITPPKIIREEAELGEKTVEKISDAAKKILHLGIFKTGWEIMQERERLCYITTGNQEFDDLLGGGIELGSIIEFYGAYRTGKTQVVHQLCVNVQLPKEQGGLNGNVIFIDSENTFRPERIKQMSESLELDPEETLKRIVYGRAYNSAHQIKLIKQSTKIIKEKNIKLIVIDSLIGHFRAEYIGRGTLASRQQILNTHIHDLMRLTDIYPELAIVCTNQVSARPDAGVYMRNPITATGGNIMAHGFTTRVFLRKGKGEQRIAKIVDSPCLPEGESLFRITDKGIE